MSVILFATRKMAPVIRGSWGLGGGVSGARSMAPRYRPFHAVLRLLPYECCACLGRGFSVQTVPAVRMEYQVSASFLLGVLHVAGLRREDYKSQNAWRRPVVEARVLCMELSPCHVPCTGASPSRL